MDRKTEMNVDIPKAVGAVTSSGVQTLRHGQSPRCPTKRTDTTFGVRSDAQAEKKKEVIAGP